MLTCSTSRTVLKVENFDLVAMQRSLFCCCGVTVCASNVCLGLLDFAWFTVSVFSGFWPAVLLAAALLRCFYDVASHLLLELLCCIGARVCCDFASGRCRSLLRTAVRCCLLLLAAARCCLLLRHAAGTAAKAIKASISSFVSSRLSSCRRSSLDKNLHDCQGPEFKAQATHDLWIVALV